ncbi:IpaD/SipD/SspD family type III secretion system needle tip protein [Stenotrophomonas sp. VV52]|uniref:IpaD/SipD/SspD family type III secretion system needle tip protein n=1 Tax=Stenotrophomonas sp. VV52 TaxID=2066958 RepID=UPI000C9E7C1F|nr:IpaD/SipD/SspD family type III secretion system needle tip protein [Stenotrophomonas sp. VV52]
MATAISTTNAQFALRAFGIQTAETPAASLEAASLDPELQSRLRQLNGMARAAQRDAIVFGRIVSEHDAGLPDQRDMARFEAAYVRTQQSQSDLLRALDFLMPRALAESGSGEGAMEEGGSGSAKDLDAGGLVWSSHAQFFEQISALIAILQSEYLSKFQDALSQFLVFYDSFSNIMEMLKPVASGDKGDITIDFTLVHAELKKLANETLNDSMVLGKFTSQAAAEAFKKSVGLPGLNLYGPGADGVYRLTMDTSAVDDLVSSMEDKNGDPLPKDHKMDSAQYNAWISAKDSNMEQVKHVSKVLGEKLNEATQKFDNIVKILSSSIDKMTEANMSYVRNT